MHIGGAFLLELSISSLSPAYMYFLILQNTRSGYWTCQFFFMPPAWKVRRGHLVIGSSVRPSVRNSVPLTSKVQYFQFGWWYSNQTWTVSSSIHSSQFTDITCPLASGGFKMLDLEIFAIFWLCCHRGHLCFTNTCLVSIRTFDIVMSTSKF